jgi:hypothetical protein
MQLWVSFGPGRYIQNATTGRGVRRPKPGSRFIIYTQFKTKKTIPAPVPGPPHPKREKQRPGLPHRARGVSWRPAGSCLGSNGIDWRKNGPRSGGNWRISIRLKTNPRAGTRPSSPQTGKTAPGLATQGKRSLVAPCWFLFGLQRDRLAQERGRAVVGTNELQ